VTGNPNPAQPEHEKLRQNHESPHHRRALSCAVCVCCGMIDPPYEKKKTAIKTNYPNLKFLILIKYEEDEFL
jgi:hypothetical protein